VAGTRRDAAAEEEVYEDSECLKYIALCRASLLAGEFDEAKRYAFRVTSRNRSERGTYDVEVGYLFDEINEAGMRMLAEADARVEKEHFFAAIAKYTTVEKLFSHVPVGKEAKEKIARAKKLMRGKPQGALKDKEAGDQFSELISMLKSEWARTGKADGKQKVEAVTIIVGMDEAKQKKVVRRLQEIVELYGATAYGQKARLLLGKLKAEGSIEISSRKR